MFNLCSNFNFLRKKRWLLELRPRFWGGALPHIHLAGEVPPPPPPIVRSGDETIPHPPQGALPYPRPQVKPLHFVSPSYATALFNITPHSQKKKLQVIQQLYCLQDVIKDVIKDVRAQSIVDF